MSADKENQVSRTEEVLLAIVLMLLTAFLLLCIGSGLAEFAEGRPLTLDSIVTLSVFALIAFGFGTLAYRLIKGKRDGTRNQLFSNTALHIWGTVFGVLGVLVFGMALVNLDFWPMVSALYSIWMGLEACRVAKKRRANQT